MEAIPGLEGGKAKLELKQRRGDISNEKIAADIIGMVLYVCGCVQQFPRDILSARSTYVDIEIPKHQGKPCPAPITGGNVTPETMYGMVKVLEDRCDKYEMAISKLWEYLMNVEKVYGEEISTVKNEIANILVTGINGLNGQKAAVPAHSARANAPSPPQTPNMHNPGATLPKPDQAQRGDPKQGQGNQGTDQLFPNSNNNNNPSESADHSASSLTALLASSPGDAMSSKSSEHTQESEHSSEQTPTGNSSGAHARPAPNMQKSQPTADNRSNTNVISNSPSNPIVIEDDITPSKVSHSAQSGAKPSYRDMVGDGHWQQAQPRKRKGPTHSTPNTNKSKSLTGIRWKKA